jgi:uncharacterized protein involved in cysteine biosynthesis
LERNYEVIKLKKEKKFNGKLFLKDFYPCGGGIIFMVIFFLMNCFLLNVKKKEKK